MLRMHTDSIACVSKEQSSDSDDEARALSELYAQHAEGVSHARFGKLHKIGSAGMVWQYLNGHRPLNIGAATKFALALGVKIDDFSPRLSAEIRAAAMLVAPEPTPDGFDPRLPVVVADVLKHASRADRDMWIAVTQSTLHHSSHLCEEDRAKYTVILQELALDEKRKLQ